jgi:hypothetical protein
MQQIAATSHSLPSAFTEARARHSFLKKKALGKESASATHWSKLVREETKFDKLAAFGFKIRSIFDRSAMLALFEDFAMLRSDSGFATELLVNVLFQFTG